jgi:hypothetical protein
LADFFKSSSLKPLGQMNRNLTGSIYDRYSIEIAHFVLIRLQTWPPQAIQEDFKKSANQKQELPMVAMFVSGSELN